MNPLDYAQSILNSTDGSRAWADLKEDEKKEIVRRLIRTDLLFLLYVLGYGPHLGQVHKKVIIPFIQDDLNYPHKLYMGHRGIGKTMIIRAKIIQDILRDPDERICLIMWKKDMAKRQLRSIKGHLQKNAILNWAFPDLLWDFKKEKPDVWSNEEFTIKGRKSDAPEATVEAGCLDPAPTGGHYTRFYLDDIVTKENSMHKELIEGTKDKWAYFYSIINPEDSGKKPGPITMVGTRYDSDDLLGDIEQDEDFKTLKVPAFADKEMAERVGAKLGHPVFFEKFTTEYLDLIRRKQGEYIFYCQYLLEPYNPSSALVKTEWLNKTYRELPENFVVITTIDPATDAASGTGKGCVLTCVWDEDGCCYPWLGSSGNFTGLELANVVLLHRRLCLLKLGKKPHVGLERAATQVAYKTIIELANKWDPFEIEDLHPKGQSWMYRALPIVARLQEGKVLWPDLEFYSDSRWWVDAMKSQLRRAKKGQIRKGELDWLDTLAYQDQMYSVKYCRPVASDDNYASGDNRMITEDDIIGY